MSPRRYKQTLEWVTETAIVQIPAEELKTLHVSTPSSERWSITPYVWNVAVQSGVASSQENIWKEEKEWFYHEETWKKVNDPGWYRQGGSPAGRHPWCDAQRRALQLCCVHPKAHDPGLTMRKASDRHQFRDILINAQNCQGLQRQRESLRKWSQPRRA